MFKLFRKLITVVRPRMHLGREMALARQINLVLMLSMLTELIIEIFLSFFIDDFINYGTLRVGLLAITCYLNIFLIGKNKFLAAKISTIFLIPFLLFFFPLFIPRLHAEFIWYPYAAITCSLIPFLILDFEKERTFLKISFANFIFYIFFLDIISKFLGNETLVRFTSEELVVTKIAQAFIFIFVSSAIHYLKRQNRLHEGKIEKAKLEILNKNMVLELQSKELLAQNQILKEHKEELLAANEELNQYQQELQTKNEQLQHALDSLKQTQAHLIHAEKMASIGVLTASIAHEINNPLNYISAGVDGLKAINEELEQEIVAKNEAADVNDNLSNLHKEAVKISDNINKGLHRAAEIVGSLNRYARMENDQLEYCDVTEIIQSAITIISVKVKSRIQFHIDSIDKNMLFCYPVSMGQILINILSNAIDSIPENGNIWVNANIINGFMRIQIKDDGKGMDEKIKDRVFEPFFTTKEFGKGTGLGLAIVKELADKHLAEINLESTKNVGTSFEISIPTNLDTILNG